MQPSNMQFVKEPGVEILPTVRSSEFTVPAIIADAGDKASEHILEFFEATIRNKNTRTAYVHAAAELFRWCDEHALRLATIRPLYVSANIESMPLTVLSVEQHLAALRGCSTGWLSSRSFPITQPCSSKGQNSADRWASHPSWMADQMRLLLDSIEIASRARARVA
jgi:integrase/recombinase XerD